MIQHTHSLSLSVSPFHQFFSLSKTGDKRVIINSTHCLHIFNVLLIFVFPNMRNNYVTLENVCMSMPVKTLLLLLLHLLLLVVHLRFYSHLNYSYSSFFSCIIFLFSFSSNFLFFLFYFFSNSHIIFFFFTYIIILSL